MNYYLMQKEENIVQIQLLSNEAKDILHKLDEIESNVGIQNILPFYYELIEILRMGQKIEVDDLDNYYKHFSDTFHYSRMRLSDAYRCFALDCKPLVDEAYKLCPWFQRLGYRIKKYFKTL